MRGDDVSDVMSHPSPTPCIHAPTSETSPAIQNARNAGRASGAHVDTGAVFEALGGSAGMRADHAREAHDGRSEGATTSSFATGPRDATLPHA